MATYSIRDLEKISGIKAHTLRMWEQRYEILHPKRTETNIRYYDDEDLRLLLSISMLNDSGYKISHIARMGRDEIHRACGSLREVGDEYGHQISALTLATVELDEERFEKSLASCMLKYGFEETMVRIIYPFFERIGLLWQTGAVIPAQEHFISNLVRQKLIVAIDAQEPVRDQTVPKYALYLPEHEMHELGLLFACYMLRSRRNRVIYLGQSVPEADLASIWETYKPDYFVTILTIVPPKESVHSYLTRLGKRFGSCKFLVAGQATDGLLDTPDNVIVLTKVSELLRHVAG